MGGQQVATSCRLPFLFTAPPAFKSLGDLMSSQTSFEAHHISRRRWQLGLCERAHYALYMCQCPRHAPRTLDFHLGCGARPKARIADVGRRPHKTYMQLNSATLIRRRSPDGTPS